MVLDLDAVFSSTSTSTANAEYEYENPGKTSIETLKLANSATSKPEPEELFPRIGRTVRIGRYFVVSVVFIVFTDGFRPCDDQSDLVWTARFDAHGQFAGVVGSVFSMDDSHGARPVVGDVFDGDHLNDNDSMLASDGAVVFPIGREAKRTVLIDRSGRLDRFAEGFGFDDSYFHGRAIFEDDLAFDLVGFELAGIATEGKSTQECC